MTIWLVAALAFAATLAPFLAGCLRGDPVARAAALVPATTVLALFVLALAAHAHTKYLGESALVLVIASTCGALFSARMLERWL